MRVHYDKGDKPTEFQIEPGELEYNATDDILYVRGNHNDILRINERGSWMALGAPSAYVSGGVSAWSKGKSSGSMFKQLPNGIEILVTGQYRLVYYQRSNLAATSVYGYVTINGSRSQAENNPNGVFYHDHAFEVSTSVFSSYIGLLNAGDWVSGGADVDAELVYGTADWAGNLTVTRL